MSIVGKPSLFCGWSLMENPDSADSTLSGAGNNVNQANQKHKAHFYVVGLGWQLLQMDLHALIYFGVYILMSRFYQAQENFWISTLSTEKKFVTWFYWLKSIKMPYRPLKHSIISLFDLVNASENKINNWNLLWEISLSCRISRRRIVLISRTLRAPPSGEWSRDRKVKVGEGGVGRFVNKLA